MRVDECLDEQAPVTTNSDLDTASFNLPLEDKHLNLNSSLRQLNRSRTPRAAVPTEDCLAVGSEGINAP